MLNLRGPPSYAPTRRLAISTLAKYDSDAGETGINTRITWTLFTWARLNRRVNCHYVDPTEAGFRALQRDAEEVTVKMKWDLQLCLEPNESNGLARYVAPEVNRPARNTV
jgi:hypothetical protein